MIACNKIYLCCFFTDIIFSLIHIRLPHFITVTFHNNCVQPYKIIYHTRSNEAAHLLAIPYSDYKQHNAFTHMSNTCFLFGSKTMDLNFSDLSNWLFIEFILCSFEDASLDKAISAIAFYHINIPTWFPTYFPSMDNGFDYPNDLHVQNAFFLCRINAIEILHLISAIKVYNVIGGP